MASHQVNLFAHGGEAVLEILARGRDGEATPVQPASLNRAAKVGLSVEDKEPTWEKKYLVVKERELILYSLTLY